MSNPDFESFTTETPAIDGYWYTAMYLPSREGHEYAEKGFPFHVMVMAWKKDSKGRVDDALFPESMQLPAKNQRMARDLAMKYREHIQAHRIRLAGE